jgi:predicted nucleic acid-binding protein
MTVTFVDAGVLIAAAARGTMDVSAQAMAILDDPNRAFASSEFIRLEVLPKALFNRKSMEAEFYSSFFQAVAYWPEKTDAVVSRGYDVAIRFGLGALDALHVAAALSVGAEKFITTEKRGKPLHRITGILVRSIQSDLPR